MKKVFNIIIIIACFLFTFNLFNASSLEAKSNTNISLTSKKADYFLMIRVYEVDRYFIYVYTVEGIFVSKMEEL